MFQGTSPPAVCALCLCGKKAMGDFGNICVHLQYTWVKCCSNVRCRIIDGRNQWIEWKELSITRGGQYQSQSGRLNLFIYWRRSTSDELMGWKNNDCWGTTLEFDKECFLYLSFNIIRTAICLVDHSHAFQPFFVCLWDSSMRLLNNPDTAAFFSLLNPRARLC